MDGGTWWLIAETGFLFILVVLASLALLAFIGVLFLRLFRWLRGLFWPPADPDIVAHEAPAMEAQADTAAPRAGLGRRAVTARMVRRRVWLAIRTTWQWICLKAYDLCQLIWSSITTLCGWIWLGIRALNDWILRPRRLSVRVLRALTIPLILYGAVIWTYFIALAPWADESRWSNHAALAARARTAQATVHTSKVDPTITALTERVTEDGTLVALAISGGGTRAAYFSAAVLERLAKVRWPGQDGPAGSLVEHVDIISSVSGGSVAAAYFALNRPAPSKVTDKELAQFLGQFKQAMATDIESLAFWNLLNPRNTLAMLTFFRPLAEAIADGLDRVLGGQKTIEFGDLRRRLQDEHAPILLLNATNLGNMNPFVFTSDPTQRPVFVAAPGPSEENVPSLRRPVDQGHVVETFGPSYGALESYRVADAVAASAAYPVFLRFIALGIPSITPAKTVRLGDGGLVDNLGLLTLYALLLDPDIYRLTRGRLRRIVVLSIDSENLSVQTGLLAGLEGLHTWSQEALHRFVAPAMFDRALRRELADVYEDEWWRENLRPPAPIFISYGMCSPEISPQGFASRAPTGNISIRSSLTAYLIFNFGKSRPPSRGPQSLWPSPTRVS